MLLTINANNTNVKFAVCEGDRMVGDWRLKTDAGPHRGPVCRLAAPADADGRHVAGADRRRHHCNGGAAKPVPSEHAVREAPQDQAPGGRRPGREARHRGADGHVAAGCRRRPPGQRRRRPHQIQEAAGGGGFRHGDDLRRGRRRRQLCRRRHLARHQSQPRGAAQRRPPSCRASRSSGRPGRSARTR